MGQCLSKQITTDGDGQVSWREQRRRGGERRREREGRKKKKRSERVPIR
jgi:hypothetical protein